MLSFFSVTRTSVAFAICIAIFGLLFGPFHLFPGSSIQFGVSSAGIVIVALIALLLSRFEKERRFEIVFGEAASAILLLYFLSDLPTRSGSFAQSAFLLIPWIAASVLAYVVFRDRKLCFLCIISTVTIVAALGGYLSHAGNSLLFTDDHPSFLYRLTQLKDNFPNIPFYNPLWNAGVEAREFFASGILNIFAVFSPVIYLFDLTSSYTYIVLSLLFLVVPLIALLTARIVNLPSGAAAVFVMLSITFSLLWYRWSLSYGTLGFILSAALVPLNLALFAKFLAANGNVSIFFSVGIAISSTLMLLWSPSAILFLPLLLLIVPRLSSLATKKVAWMTLCFLLFLNVPWMGAFLKFSKVADFVAVSQNQESTLSGEQVALSTPAHDLSKFRMSDTKKIGVSWQRQILNRIRDNFIPVNPLVIFFGLPGLLLLRDKSSRHVFGLACLSAVMLGILGPGLKPQLELERMIVVLGLILSLPAAVLIHEFLSKHSRPVITCSLMGLLAFSPIWLWIVTSNLSTEKYVTAAPIVQELATAIKQNAGEGRTLFAGFILHELSQGHVAPLAYWTGQPLIASSYQHDRWRYLDIIPEEYRSQKESGVLKYLDLMNVTSVITHDRFWRKWFSTRPDLFEKVWQAGVFQLFRRKQYKSDYFYEGQGQIIKQSGSNVVLIPESRESVVKFNYLPFLKASNCNIQPAKISESITFIKLVNCDLSRNVSIEASGIESRLF